MCLSSQFRLSAACLHHKEGSFPLMSRHRRLQHQQQQITTLLKGPDARQTLLPSLLAPNLPACRPPVIAGIKLALDKMANERFKLRRELTGAFRSSTPAKADRSLPIQQICVPYCVCDRELVFNLGVIVRITVAMLGFDARPQNVWSKMSNQQP